MALQNASDVSWVDGINSSQSLSISVSYIYIGGSGNTLTLPQPSAFHIPTVTWIVNQGSASVDVEPAGGNTLDGASSNVTTIPQYAIGLFISRYDSNSFNIDWTSGVIS